MRHDQERCDTTADASAGPSGQASPTRRRFLTSAVAGAAVGGLGMSAATRAFGAHSGGDAHLRVGVIGCGGRGKGACRDALIAGDDVKIVAMADAFEDNVEAAHRMLSEEFGDRIDAPKERRFAGFDAYKSVIDGDCDLIILATPPGFRPMHFEAAIEANKHVFMEKPVAVDAPGVRKILEIGRKATEKRLAVGVGLQRHHEAHYNEMVQRIWDGAIGDEVLYTRVYWNGGGVWTRPRKPNQTEMEYQMRNWYYFNWLCGDHIVEQHIHNLDVSNWVKQAHPAKANGMGGREFRRGKDHGQIYDHHFVEFTYPDGSTMMSQCRHIPDTWTQVDEYAHGAKGHCHLGRGQIYDRDGKRVVRLKPPFKPGYVQEHIDLQACIKANDPYNETENGAIATMTAILGRMATYSGRVVTWDEAIASDKSLAPETYAFDATPPVTPDAEGNYPVAVPGQTEVV